MMISDLDRNTALVVIDLQQGFREYPFVHPIAGVIAQTRGLLNVFRSHNLPVVLVNVVGRPSGRTERAGNASFDEGWAELMPELDRQADDIIVTKRSWGAFTHTALEEKLRSLEVTQLVITGVITSGGVEATARQGYEFGFNVSLVIDAITDLQDEAHNYSVEKIFPRLGETLKSSEVIEVIDTRKA